MMKDYLPLLKKVRRHFSLAHVGIEGALGDGFELMLEALDFYAAHIFLFNPLNGFLECQRSIIRGRGNIAGEGKVQIEDNKDNFMVQVFLGEKKYAFWNNKLSICVPVKSPQGSFGVLAADKIKNSFSGYEIKALIDFADEFSAGIYDINCFLEEQQKRSKFQALCKITGSLTATLKLEEILAMILNSRVNDLKFDRAKLYLKNDKKGVVYGLSLIHI